MNKNELDLKFPIEYTWEAVGNESVMYHIESINVHGYITTTTDDPTFHEVLEKSIRRSVLSYLNVRTDIPVDKERIDEYL